MTVLRRLVFAAAAVALSATPALAADSWGAVAVGPGGAFGWAVDYDTEAEAAAEVRKQCGNDCEGITFRNSCASIALGSNGGAWGLGDTREEAERNALASCAKDYAGCAVKVWGCTRR
jgi:hypothetical protein